MVTQSPDTTLEAEKVQIDLIRKSSIPKRLSVAHSLSETTRYLSKRGIKRANPNFSKREVDLAFVKFHYGEELADRLRLFLESGKL